LFLQFENQKLIDFSLQENRKAMQEALNQVNAQMGRHYPAIIGGKKRDASERIVSINPSNIDEVIGTCAKADSKMAQEAIDAASGAFESWKRVPPEERANYLFKAAEVMKERRFEFSAWIVMEAGKTWKEADADTAEAIDFLEFYGKQMLYYAKGMPVSKVPGEENECFYIPIGVGAVISPWNFPLAILTGTTVCGVVAGNTVVVKPASNTPVIAAKFAEIWQEIGLPDGVINFLPGPGDSVGDYLTSSPETGFINFTGSKDVGLRINKLAAEIVPGQKRIKRVVAELGGKNAIIVDKSANLDAAAEGIVTSAFGYQGQKCSACSRAIIHKDVYDEMVERIVAKAEKLKVGPAKDYESDMGPVIDEKALNKICRYIEIGKSEGKLILGGKALEGGGYFIEPTIFEGVKSDAVIAKEEIFGPVLAIMKAEDFDDALNIANDTDYGLSGSVYAADREKLNKAREDFNVGNLYFNRKCTGALVGGHPFGGFNMSGTDSKAGGADYLLHFMQAKAVSEKIM